METNNFQIPLEEALKNADRHFRSLYGTATRMEAINRWACDATAGLVPNYLSTPISGSLAVLNALYFKAPWYIKFDKSLTSDAEFHNLDGTTCHVPMMRCNELITNYGKTANGQILRLPFGSWMYDMTIFLPNEGVDFHEYATTLQASDINGGDRIASIILEMPRFTTESKRDITTLLQSMGLSASFERGFNNMLKSSNIYLSAIMQATRITVDEDGAEGAVVTSAGIMQDKNEDVQRVNVSLNRPFVFAITERSSGAVIFIGQVTGF